MSALYYPAIIERAGSAGFSVFFPDIPGCTSAGDTVQEAALAAEEALAGHLAVALEHGDDIGEPTALDLIETDPDVEEVARMLVRAETNTQFVRIQVSIPANVLARIDRVAKGNRSAFLAEAALARLTYMTPLSVHQRIEEAVRVRPGMSQREIAEAVFGDAGYQQRVNQDCAWLTSQNRIMRARGRPARYYAPGSVPADVELEAA